VFGVKHRVQSFPRCASMPFPLYMCSHQDSEYRAESHRMAGRLLNADGNVLLEFNGNSTAAEEVAKIRAKLADYEAQIANAATASEAEEADVFTVEKWEASSAKATLLAEIGKLEADLEKIRQLDYIRLTLDDLLSAADYPLSVHHRSRGLLVTVFITYRNTEDMDDSWVDWPETIMYDMTVNVTSRHEASMWQSATMAGDGMSVTASLSATADVQFVVHSELRQFSYSQLVQNIVSFGYVGLVVFGSLAFCLSFVCSRAYRNARTEALRGGLGGGTVSFAPVVKDNSRPMSAASTKKMDLEASATTQIFEQSKGEEDVEESAGGVIQEEDARAYSPEKIKERLDQLDKMVDVARNSTTLQLGSRMAEVHKTLSEIGNRLSDVENRLIHVESKSDDVRSMSTRVNQMTMECNEFRSRFVALERGAGVKRPAQDGSDMSRLDEVQSALQKQISEIGQQLTELSGKLHQAKR